MRKHVLLVEIGTDELPPKMLRKFGESFAKNVECECKTSNIIYEKVIWFASSRRLAIQVIDIIFDFNVDVNLINRNASKIQFDENEVIFDEFFFLKEKNIKLLLFSIVNNALMRLPISVMMKWKTENVRFVRPVRTVSVLLDDKVILCNLFGVISGRVIRGHRFMGSKEISLEHAKKYQEILLKKGFVIANYEERKDIICRNIDHIAKKIGGIVDYTGNLLEEVTGLSEWPVVLFGSFDERFLDIPREILLYVMEVQKKYFPLYNFKGDILPYFIFVIDVISKNNEKIIKSHEKFLHLSFSDVRFFLNSDAKFVLEEHVSCLDSILFYKNLGTLYNKSMRMKSLSSWVATMIGINVCQVERAAMLSKCDLLSNMVTEFSFSQGIIGMYYAIRDGECEEVALAQKEQYQPRFSSDILPSTLISCVISIVDKVDTITGMFIIGECPKGNRDPMGIRRAAIGVLRIIIEKRIKINLWDLVERSLNLYKDFSVDGCVQRIISFMYKRLCILYKQKGYKIDIIKSVLSNTLDDLSNFDSLIHEVSAFCLLERSRLLFVMYKRIFKILRDVSEFFSFRYEIDESLLVKQEEIYLLKKILIVHRELEFLYEKGCYYDSLNLIISLYDPLDNFFENVVILSNKKNFRLNRLILLSKLWFLLSKIIKTPQHLLL